MLKRLAKNTTVLSLGTLFCRILGLIRDILIATYFGTSKILEAFIVAFRIPNVFRSLLGEGFSDSVATPVLSEYHNQRERFLLLGRRLFSVSLIILGIVVILGILFSKYLVIVIAPGFLKDSYKLSLANIFTKITFFYLF
ncbi:MAG: murein biosynthesis integral membrane protein MurJ, partial [Candidatus Omnitrophota bacterium]